MVPMVAVLAVEGCPRWIKRLLGAGPSKQTYARAAPAAAAAARAPTADEAGGRRLSGNQKLDDPRKVSSANLLSLPAAPSAAGAGENDEKEGPADGGLLVDTSDGREQQHARPPRHAKRLSVSILPFQETVLPVPVSQGDGAVRGFVCMFVVDGGTSMKKVVGSLWLHLPPHPHP